VSACASGGDDSLGTAAPGCGYRHGSCAVNDGRSNGDPLGRNAVELLQASQAVDTGRMRKPLRCESAAAVRLYACAAVGRPE